tara:strand:+ start:390 stop:731 length:342 start_codon:yes stop_codon:yes gene_type:complete
MARMRLIPEGEPEFPITAQILSNLLSQKSVTDRQCLEEFEYKCQQMDWTYAMSDDHRYWVSGQEQMKELNELYDQFQLGSLADDAKTIYEHYHCRAWGKKTIDGVPGEILKGE